MPTPAYIRDLRQLWGHRPLLLPGVSGVVVDGPVGAERVLLVRRTDTGQWSVPAGIVEPDEQPADCIARELWEETRIRARPTRLSLLRTEPELTYPNGDRCQFVSLTFRCHYLSGTAVVGDEESTEVGWFAVGALPPELSDRAHRRITSALPAEGPCLFELATN